MLSMLGHCLAANNMPGLVCLCTACLATACLFLYAHGVCMHEQIRYRIGMQLYQLLCITVITLLVTHKCLRRPTAVHGPAHRGVDSTVILLEAGHIVLDPDEDVGVDSCGNVDEHGSCQHYVHKEDNPQGQLQAEL